MLEFINTAVTALNLEPSSVAVIGVSIAAVAMPIAKAALVTFFPQVAPVFAFIDVVARQYKKVVDQSADKNEDLKKFAQEKKLKAVSYLIKP